MTNRSPWKDPPFLSSVNHLFQWAIYTMAMLNNQRVIYMYIPKTVVYFPKVPNPFFFHLKGVGIIYIYTHSVIVYIIYEIQTYNYIIYYFWSWVVLSNPNRGSLKKAGSLPGKSKSDPPLIMRSSTCYSFFVCWSLEKNAILIGGFNPSEKY